MQQLGTLSPSLCPQGLLVPATWLPALPTTLEDKRARAAEDRGGRNQQHALAWKEGQCVREADSTHGGRHGKEPAPLLGQPVPASCRPPRREPRAGLWAAREGRRSGRLLGSAILPGPSPRSRGRSLFIPGVTKRASGKCHQTGDPSPSLDRGYSTPDPSIAWVSSNRTPCYTNVHYTTRLFLRQAGKKPSLPGDFSPGYTDVEGKDRNWWSLVTPKAC